jgi:hypothetical protein
MPNISLVDHTFKGNAAIPLASSFLISQFKPRFRHIDIAELVPLLIKKFGQLSYSKVHSTLVNVYSSYTDQSYGYLGPPPDEIRSLNSKLQFTFALKAFDEDTADESEVIHRAIRTAMWAENSLVTVGLSSVECSDLQIMTFNENDLKYLYNVVGVIFRSIFLHYTPTQIVKLGRGEEPKVNKNVFALKDKYLHASLSSIVKEPYHYWKYALSIWTYAPNLIPYRDLDEEFGFYYFLFISGKVPPVSSTADGLSRVIGIPSTGRTHTGLHLILVNSLLAFVQYMKSAKQDLSLEDLLAANVLAALAYTGKPILKLNRSNYYDSLLESFLAIASQLDNAFDHNALVQLLSPYEKTAEKLIRGDKDLANSLMEKLSYDLYDY